MRALFLTGIAAAALVVSTPLLAADMPLKAPPPPVSDWTGVYLGVNGGYGWATSSQAFGPFFSTGNYNQTGGLVGGTYGGNWETPSRIVLGFEGDADWSRINGTAAICGIVACFTNLQSIGTERLRVGYDLGGWMPYVTGGAAWGRIKAGVFSCVVAFLCNSDTSPGYTVGGGVEWMFAPHWSVKAEYLYYNFGTVLALYAPVPGLGVNVSESGSMVRGGINYHLDWFK